MSKFNFTKSSVEAVRAPTAHEAKKTGYVIHWDEQIPGLGLKVTVRAVKVFIFSFRNFAGRSRRYTIGRYGKFTVEQARHTAKKLLGDVAAGVDPVDRKKEVRQAATFDELMERYINEHVVPHRSEFAVRGAKRVRRTLRKSLGHKLVHSLDDTHVREALKPFTSMTGNWNLFRTYIGAAWSWGRRHRVIPKNLPNPVDDVEIFPCAPQARIVTPAEYKRIFAAIDKFLSESKHDPARLLAILWVIETGCRPIEATRIKRPFVDFDRGVVELFEHKTFSVTKVPKKFFLTDTLIELIERADALKKMRGIESEFVFPRRSKQKASNWLAKTWAAIQKEAKVDIDLRQMRSAFINAADDMGFDEREIMEMTQHMSPSVLKRHYRMFKDKRGAQNARHQADGFKLLRQGADIVDLAEARKRSAG